MHESDESNQKSEPFEILRNELVYKRYIQVHKRDVKFSNEKTISYDIVSHGLEHQFICCMIYYSTTKQLVILKEYSQGINDFLFTFPCGGYEKDKHKTLEDCARSEVLEEAGILGGNLVYLLKDKAKGIAEVKWCANRFFPFILIDPNEAKLENRLLDHEEYIEVLPKISFEEMDLLISQGKIMLPTVQTYFMAKNYLFLT